MALVWGLFQVSEKRHFSLHVPTFCPDKFTISLIVLRFSVSLTCFMSFLTALVLWWYLPQLSSANIDLFVCSLSPVLLIGFENRGSCTYVCVFCMTSEMILVFQVCSYFRRNIIIFPSFNEAYLTTKNYIYLKLQNDVLMYVYTVQWSPPSR